MMTCKVWGRMYDIYSRHKSYEPEFPLWVWIFTCLALSWVESRTLNLPLGPA